MIKVYILLGLYLVASIGIGILGGKQLTKWKKRIQKERFTETKEKTQTAVTVPRLITPLHYMFFPSLFVICLYVHRQNATENKE